MTLCHQVSLRISDEHKRAIRVKLEELRSEHPYPTTVTEADAHRALLDEAKARLAATQQEADK
ncbi:MAG: hypothetical protein WC982_05085 [Advenella sp.]